MTGGQNNRDCFGNYGNTLSNDLYYLIGREVTVFFMEGAPVRGVLQAVGKDYLEIRRRRDGQREAVLIPLNAVNVITGPAV
ncbi:MAG: hypothetical protein K9L17_02605 [Clostridiales bacterium]|nr:hypothetical protein [Clostridiales bacterium]MCF8021570.1 hypothetical protein [Clostridiales bacterium]